MSARVSTGAGGMRQRPASGAGGPGRARRFGLYRRLLQYAWPYRLRLGQAMVLGVLFAAANAAIPWALKHSFEEIFEEQSEGISRAARDDVLTRLEGPTLTPAVRAEVEQILERNTRIESRDDARLRRAHRRSSFWRILRYAAMVPLIGLLRGLADFGNRYLMGWVGDRAVTDLRNDLFAHIHQLSLEFFGRVNIGQMISRVTSDAQMIQRAVSTVLSDLVMQPVTLVGLIGVLFYENALLAAGSLLLFPAVVLPIVYYGRRVRDAARRAQERVGELVDLLHESFTGVRIVKGFCMEEYEVDKFRRQANRLFRQLVKVLRASCAVEPLIVVVSCVGIGITFVYCYEQGVSYEEFVGFAVALVLMYEPAKKLSRIHVAIQQSLGAAERIFQIMDERPTVVDRPGARSIPTLARGIRFEGVSFAYQQAPVLRGIDLDVPAGTLLAIVGPSGAGKTTLCNLIPRFYDPTAGRVTIDEVDLRDATLRSVRSQIGIVTQETILFNDTVARNIAYGKPDAGREEVEAAARRANAHRFITEMEDGYDAVIGERGSRLSGGQRQRLAIARAILKNPPILILDEATSSLDSESEQLVQQALDELMAERTVFAIAHRLSTVLHADRIIVLEEGRIVEQGTHAELLRLGRAYERLYRLQFRTEESAPMPASAPA